MLFTDTIVNSFQIYNIYKHIYYFHSLVFFTSPGALHKANIDGSEHVVIASIGMRWAFDVAFDRSNKRVCWTDTSTGP